MQALKVWLAQRSSPRAAGPRLTCVCLCLAPHPHMLYHAPPCAAFHTHKRRAPYPHVPHPALPQAPSATLRPARLSSKPATRYVAKLHVNGHFVDRTRGVTLEDGFATSFNEVFRCT